MSKATIRQIKEDLSRYKLKTTGTKAELIARYNEHIRPKVPRKHPLTGILDTDLYILSMVPSEDLVNLLTVNKYFADIMPHVVRDLLMVEYGADISGSLGNVTYYAAYHRILLYSNFDVHDLLALLIDRGWSQLILPTIHKFKEKHCDPGITDILGFSLVYAIEHEREDIVMDLISAGAPVEWKDGLPVHTAAKVNNDRIMAALTGAGVETITDAFIWKAIIDNNMAYIMFCIHNGAVISENMLMCMVVSDRYDMITALLRTGVLTLRQ